MCFATLFWRYDLTAEQLFYMVNISMKYFVALPVAIFIYFCKNPSEFAASLNSIGISYKVGYSVAIAFVTFQTFSVITTASVRPSRPEAWSLEKWALFCPVEEFGEYSPAADPYQSEQVDTISNAMELRGFGKE